MRKPFWKHAVVVGVVCALVGASLGISTSLAASGKNSGQRPGDAQAGPPQGAPPHGGRPGRGGPGGPGGPGGVHAEIVVPDQDGEGFVTLVSDVGTLAAISGSELTVKEGTKDETYATVTVTADGTVSVRRNGKKSTLSALKVGDHVRVTKDGTRTRIDASTASWEGKQGGQPPHAPSWPSV